MRFPVVLFDLDGTIVDSGWMILASFRHATRTVLARDFPDEVLLAHVGGATLDEQMRALDPARVDDLVASYREHNEPLHDELEPCAGDTAVNRHAKVVQYGAKWSRGAFTCLSRKAGLRCHNRGGHGFFLNKKHSYRF